MRAASRRYWWALICEPLALRAQSWCSASIWLSATSTGGLSNRRSNLHVTEGDDSFRVSFDARNHHREVDFSWHGEIVGSADGTIEYRMDGTVNSSFRYNKIHLCVHHPVAGTAGHRFIAQTTAGELEGRLPSLVGPQMLDERGIGIPLIPAFTALSIQATATATVRFQFEGDLWETEDQRNWTDASFKTYGTPEALGSQEATPGQRVEQRIRISVEGRTPRRRPATDPVELAVSREAGHPLPKMGLTMGSHRAEATKREAGLLRALALDHVRIDLHLASAEWRSELERGAKVIDAVGTTAEIACFVGQDAGRDWTRCGNSSPRALFQ